MNNTYQPTDSVTFDTIRKGPIYTVPSFNDCVKVVDSLDHGTIVGQSWTGELLECLPEELQKADADEVNSWVRLTGDRRHYQALR